MNKELRLPSNNVVAGIAIALVAAVIAAVWMIGVVWAVLTFLLIRALWLLVVHGKHHSPEWKSAVIVFTIILGIIVIIHWFGGWNGVARATAAEHIPRAVPIESKPETGLSQVRSYFVVREWSEAIQIPVGTSYNLNGPENVTYLLRVYPSRNIYKFRKRTDNPRVNPCTFYHPISERVGALQLRVVDGEKSEGTFNITIQPYEVFKETCPGAHPAVPLSSSEVDFLTKLVPKGAE